MTQEVLAQKNLQLVNKVKAGDPEAFGTLYELNYHAVYCAVKTLISDKDTAEDIIQDAFIKALQEINSLQDGRRFTPWVKQIAINRAKDWFKKKKPMLFTDLSNSDEEGDEPIEYTFRDERSDSIPEDVIDGKETQRLIQEILDTLPEDQRYVICMYYYNQMSAKDIAKMLDISESTVRSKLAYGRNKIGIKVKDLEKKGTKLYGLAPIPFLLFLFKNMDVHAQEIHPDMVLKQAILSEAKNQMAGRSAADSAAGDIPGKEKISEIAQKAAGASVKFKAIAAVAVCAVVIIAAISLGGRDKDAEDDGSHAAVNTEVVQETQGLDDESVTDESVTGSTEEASTNKHDLVMAGYKNLLDVYTNAYVTDNWFDYEFTNELIIEGMNLNNGYRGMWLEEPYFALYDFYNDGIPELLMKGDTGDAVVGYDMYEYDAIRDRIIYSHFVDGYNSEEQMIRYLTVTDNYYIERYEDGAFSPYCWIDRSNGSESLHIKYSDKTEKEITKEEYDTFMAEFHLENLPVEWISLTQENVDKTFEGYY